MPPSTPPTLTRQSLHDLIWETPMSRLAPRWGISPQQLSQLCTSHEIAKPGSRYWTLKSMGRPVEKLGLAVASRGADELVTLTPRIRRAPKLAPTAVAREPDKAPAIPHAPLSAAMPPLKAKAEERAAAGDALHPAARKTRAKLEAHSEQVGDLATIRGKGLFPLSASPHAAERIGLFLSDLFQAVERCGWALSPTDKSLHFIVEGELIACELVEQTDRVPHVKTPQEIASLERFEADKARALKRKEWFSDWNRPKFAEWDYQPNGKLTLKFDAGYKHPGLRRSFSDGKHQRLESLMEAMLASFAAYAEGERAWRDEQERRRLKAIEEEKSRREAQRRQILETKRLEFLTLQMERHEQAKRVEDFVASLGEPAHGDPPLSAFLTWAAEYARQIRSSLTPEVLSRKLERSGLMDGKAEFPNWRSVE